MIAFENMFRLEKSNTRSYENSDRTIWVSVAVEMSLSINKVSRSVYTMFDMLSDIGGLLGILVSVFAIMAGIWNYLAYDNFLVSRLFRVRRQSKPSKSAAVFDSPSFAQSSPIKVSLIPNFKEWFWAVCPCIHVCKRSR